MKIQYIAFLFLAVLSLAQAAPEDYVKLYKNSASCGDFTSKTCETIYTITNPTDFPILINTANFFISYRTPSAVSLSNKLDAIKNTKLEIDEGSGFKPIDAEALSKTFMPHASFLLKVSAEKVWKPTGANSEYYAENVDNVLTAFGNQFIQFSWWNTSYPYRQEIKITNINHKNYTNFVLNVSFDSNRTIVEGKMQATCADLRVTWLNDSGDEQKIPYWLYADEGVYGTTTAKCAGATGNLHSNFYIKIPMIRNGTNATSIYIYYGNTTATSESNQNETVWFYDQPIGTQTNLSNWINSTSGAGTTTSITNNENRMLGSAVDKARLQLNYTVNRTNLLIQLNDSFFNNDTNVLGMIRIVSPATQFRLSGASLAHVWDFTGMGATAKIFSIWGNSTNTTCVYDVASTSCPVGLGKPYNQKFDLLFVECGLTAASDCRFTNITIVNKEVTPFIFSNQPENSNGSGSGLYTHNTIDEVSGATIYFNATYDNGTTTYTTPNTNSYTNLSISMPQGTNTIVVKNASYYSRTYYKTLTNASDTLTSYLLSISNPTTQFVRFHVSTESGTAVQNALVQINKSTNIIGEVLTDASGTASFYLDYNTYYSVTASKSGYPSATLSSLQPVDTDYYLILSSQSSVNFDYLFTNISWYLYPDPRMLYFNDSWITYIILSKDNKLEVYGMAIEWNKTIIYNSSNNSNPMGGIIRINVNISNYSNQYIIAHPYFKKIGYPHFYDSSGYFSQANLSQSNYFNNTGLGKYAVGIRLAGLNKNEIGLIGLLLGLLFSALLARFIGVGAGMIGLIVLFLLAALGVFSPNAEPMTLNVFGQEVINPIYWGWFAWLILVLLAVIIIRTGGV